MIRRNKDATDYRGAEQPAETVEASPPAGLTHAALVAAAAKWLKGTCGCGYVAAETVSMSWEQPDAIGFRSDRSILVECKASRADFLRDKKKPFRRRPEIGMGNYRFYMCPPDVIKPEDLPEKWGLLYPVNGRICVIVGPKGNAWNTEFWQEKNYAAEYELMYSLLRRVA